MLLLMHILVAFAGMIFTAYTYAFPSHTKIIVSTSLAGLTLATGTLLLISAPSHLLQACVMGLIYFSIVGFGVIASQRKLARSSKV